LNSSHRSLQKILATPPNNADVQPPHQP
jgi:hypothetical protein